MLVAGRLFAPDAGYPPDASRAILARAAQAEDWATLLERFDEARSVVVAAWGETFGESLGVKP
jgi:glutamate-ammonia-ligase adenylyltransferase